ncbi:MAG: T9SS type A sorting domain-containing protein [Bacteroidia bacterium]|nr:T9SS type A sorting domain-containing protein [Bacteroidia bacterium]
MRILRISLGILFWALFLHAQPSGESMSDPHDITADLFSSSTITPDYELWSWSGYDSTRNRTNDHGVFTGLTGPDVVWKIVLPECLDSLDVHFAIKDDGSGTFPSNISMIIYNPRVAEGVVLLQNSYDDYMGLWTVFAGSLWPSIYNNNTSHGPASAYLVGTEQSQVLSGGTGAGYGRPLRDSIRLAAGDTIYLIFSHNNDGPGSIESLYVEVTAIKKLRPQPVPLNLVVLHFPSQMCLGTQDIQVEVGAIDTLFDDRSPFGYIFGGVDNLGSTYGFVIGVGAFSYTVGSSSFLFLNTDPSALSLGYFDYVEKWAVRGVYKHPHYPNHPYSPDDPDCQDTTLTSDTVSYTVRITLVPDPAIEIDNDGVLHQDGATVSLVEGNHVFEAHEELGISQNLLTYEWSLDGGPWTVAPSISVNLTAGAHTLDLRVTNDPGVGACDSTIQILLDVTTPVRGAQLQPVVGVREGVLSLFIPGTGNYTAQVYDLQGRLLHQFNVEGGVTYSIPLSVRGVILLRVEGEGQVFSQSLLVE